MTTNKWSKEGEERLLAFLRDHSFNSVEEFEAALGGLTGEERELFEKAAKDEDPLAPFVAIDPNQMAIRVVEIIRKSREEPLRNE